MNLLFICSKNQWRSPTAEAIFKNHPYHHAQSAGTENGARIKVSEKHIRWADLIFVMEKKHKQRLQQYFPMVIVEKEVIILDIPDDYQFMDAELIEMIKVSVSPYLEE
ncbi:protein tyrosine phosphatase [Solitalea sp. MAHUQ-68]|uniref:Protein tyrosine phosphatase n=1 Tax=Solitalea agri TaxID=2953739 RepID=A0A9X2F613_9SPHI|nr:protein tyrosine phosphatase [Solitalea agri]MCO4292533.1 protein tyrosine phosphatase [Solitalea agri]